LRCSLRGADAWVARATAARARPDGARARHAARCLRRRAAVPPPPPPPQPTASLARWRSRAGGPWCRPGPGGHAGPGGRRAMVVKQGIEVTSAGRGELNAAFGGLGQARSAGPPQAPRATHSCL
jgi:hypothetical protein